MILRKFWISILWFLFILYGSLAPKDSLEPEWFLFKHQDKLIHFMLYGVLIILFFRNYSSYASLYKRVYVVTGISLVSISICIEILQPIVSQRSFEVVDIVSNAMGVVIGIIVYCKLSKRHCVING